MLTLGIWAATMSFLLPGTVTAVWLVYRYAEGLTHEEVHSEEHPTESFEQEDKVEYQELQFTEITSAEIDDILDYYEQRKDMSLAHQGA